MSGVSLTVTPLLRSWLGHMRCLDSVGMWSDCGKNRMYVVYVVGSSYAIARVPMITLSTLPSVGSNGSTEMVSPVSLTR